jgi:hypothetical protein
MLNHAEILKSLTFWAAHHPRPDEPTVFAGAKRFSPRQIVHEIRDRTDSGKLFLRVVEHSAESRSIDEVLKSFDTRR